MWTTSVHCNIRTSLEATAGRKLRGKLRSNIENILAGGANWQGNLASGRAPSEVTLKSTLEANLGGNLGGSLGVRPRM